MTWTLAIAMVLLSQEPAPDAGKELEAARRENQELRARAIEDARAIQRLKQIIKALESRTEAPGAPPVQPPPPAAARDVSVGPVAPLIGHVTYVDAKAKFVLISLGKRQGVKAGYRFEITRTLYDTPDGQSRKSVLGIATFEKFLGPAEETSKLIVIEGNPAEFKMDDEAVAIRRLAPVVPGAIPAPPASAPGGPEGAKEGVYKITGRAGTDATAGYIINYGSLSGARQSDIVYVCSDGKPKASLRLDTVERDFCVGNVIAGTLIAPPEATDQVFTRELRKTLLAKVQFVEEKRGIALDLKQREGAKVGQRYEVRRAGQKVGTLVLTEVQTWVSWAKPDGDTRSDQIQKGDFAELLEDK